MIRLRVKATQGTNVKEKRQSQHTYDRAYRARPWLVKSFKSSADWDYYVRFRTRGLLGDAR